MKLKIKEQMGEQQKDKQKEQWDKRKQWLDKKEGEQIEETNVANKGSKKKETEGSERRRKGSRHGSIKGRRKLNGTSQKERERVGEKERAIKGRNDGHSEIAKK